MANYRITELDFDNIKVNLKEFLSNYRDKDGKLIFTDYDFDASSLSILLDLLAYNTHYNAYMVNMLANEMFLDSAVKRESAVSLAKHLGYTPLSIRAARAVIDFELPAPVDTPPTLTLPRFTPFTTSIDGQIYNFVNLDAAIIKPEEGRYIFRDIVITEGEVLRFSYRVDRSGPGEKYKIPNRNVDTTTLLVTVQNSFTDNGTQIFQRTNDISNLTENSAVYFLEESPDGFYEIHFGDGVLGKKLIPGNIVIIDYLATSGPACNVSEKINQFFNIGSRIGGILLETQILAKVNSSGGSNAETIEDIKFKAPKFLSSFDRAVTADDYKSIIDVNYPLVESINVWGGEENIPPKYGKVLISLKPFQGYVIDALTKNRIQKEVLKNKKMLSTIVEFVDPNYLYVNVDCKIRHSITDSRYNSKQIQVLALQSIQNYFAEELQKFDKDFVFSKLSSRLDSIDKSIIGNYLNIKIQKRIAPEVNDILDFSGNNSIRFLNKLVSGSIDSTVFLFEDIDVLRRAYLKDELTDGTTGKIRLLEQFTNNVIRENFGTIDYNTGTVTLPRLKVSGYPEGIADIKLTAKTQELDINATRDIILVLDDSTLLSEVRQSSGIVINVVEE
jgi:hypothetical protein